MTTPAPDTASSRADHAQAAGPCLTCVLALSALLIAIVCSFGYLKLDVTGLFSAESGRAMRKFAAEFMSPDLSAPFLAKTAWAALQTVAVSALGTLLAGVAGALLALPAAGRFGSAARALARLVLNVLRDPKKLLLGSGKQTRFIRLDSADVLARPEVAALMNAAIDRSRTPFRATGRPASRLPHRGPPETRREGWCRCRHKRHPCNQASAARRFAAAPRCRYRLQQEFR